MEDIAGLTLGESHHGRAHASDERQLGGGVSEDREQESGEDRDEQARPTSAAARRGRRASGRSSSRKESGGNGSKDASAPKGRATPQRDGRSERVSLFRRIGRFLREVVAELRKVIWPTRKQLLTYTAVVLVFVSIMVAFIAGLDLLFAQGVLQLFGE